MLLRYPVDRRLFITAETALFPSDITTFRAVSHFGVLAANLRIIQNWILCLLLLCLFWKANPYIRSFVSRFSIVIRNAFSAIKYYHLNLDSK